MALAGPPVVGGVVRLPDVPDSPFDRPGPQYGPPPAWGPPPDPNANVPRPPLYGGRNPDTDFSGGTQGFTDKHEVSPNDVVQGSTMGDCYLMAAIMGVAQANPEAIKQLIRDNGDGSYSVHLFNEQSGQWEEFLVTADEVANGFAQPSDTVATSTVAHGTDREVWVVVLERAYAKLLDRQNGGAESPGGDVNDLANGLAKDAMVALTGYPATMYMGEKNAMGGSQNPTGLRDVLDRDCAAQGQNIQNALANGRPVSVGTRHDKADRIGPNLVPGHAYNVVSARQDEQGRWIVKLDNPWEGRNEDQPQSPGLAPGEVYLSDVINSGDIRHLDIGRTPPRTPYHHEEGGGGRRDTMPVQPPPQ